MNDRWKQESQIAGIAAVLIGAIFGIGEVLYRLASWSLIVLLCLASLASQADACGRCGLFGRGCRFSSHVVVQQAYAPAYAAPAASVQNFVFSNSFPVPYLQQGNTAFGYSLAAAPYSFDSAAYMDRASRFQELALETAQTGINGFNANAAALTGLADAVDRRTKNTMLAIAGIQANQQSAAPGANANAFQTYTLRATVRNGVLSIEREEPQPQPGVVDPGLPVPGGVQAFDSNGLLSCAKCHDGRGTHHEPKEVILDGSVALDDRTYQRVVQSVGMGKMPPQSNLSWEDRSAVIANLAKLLAK